MKAIGSRIGRDRLEQLFVVNAADDSDDEGCQAAPLTKYCLLRTLCSPKKLADEPMQTCA